MSIADETVFDDQVRTAVPDTVPPEVERRLQTQLAGFRSRFQATESARGGHNGQLARPMLRWIGVLTAAAAVLAAVVGLVLRPQTSFAQVAAAVLKQPWVHMRSVEADGSVNEVWYSPGRDVSASRRPGSVQYDDFRTGVYHSYQTAENVVYRGPAVGTSQAGDFEAMAEAIKVIVQRDEPPDQPLQSLGFLGSARDKMKVLDQGVTKVTEGGRTWLDYRLRVSYQGEGATGPLRFLFRVDADTKLPALCRIEGQAGGKSFVRESRFDYPEKGPADIYDLGVPKTTKLVDRVPAGDLDRILKTLRAGRMRMDSYRALFVKEMEGLDYQWWLDRPIILYRKGNLFRADYPHAIGNRDAVERPAQGEDLKKWWFERSKSLRYYTQYVLRDSTLYTSETKVSTEPDGKVQFDIHSVAQTKYAPFPGEEFPAEYAMRPEFVCRPPMGIGDQHQEPILELHPTDGPPGCILLSVGHTSKDGRVNEKGVGLPDGNRYWLDPQRDYIVMRWDMVMRGENGKEEIISNHTVEETAQSPQGVWYATKVRLKNAVGAKNGKQSDQVCHIYVDFDVTLPDAFFEPQKPGPVR